MWTRGILSLFFFTGVWCAQAQLQVQLLGERNTFLLYEPIIYKVQLTNTGGSSLALRDSPDGMKPWLNFLIFNATGEKVRRVPGKGMPDVMLGPGESKVYAVNLTPLYRLRDSGQYDVKASVSVPGAETRLTSSLRFHIGKGQEIWSEVRSLDGVERRYSLLRFIEGADLFMYARVEEPAERLVYSTSRLGSIVGFTEPRAQFDERGHWHVMHISESRIHRHTEMDAAGNIVKKEDFQQWQDFAPELVADGGGGLKVAKAVPLQGRRERPKLSADQSGL